MPAQLARFFWEEPFAQKAVLEGAFVQASTPHCSGYRSARSGHDHFGPAEQPSLYSTAANRRALKAAYSSFLGGGLHFHAPIDDAAATSTYKPPEVARGQLSPFHAKQALAPGTGYWCSAGNLQEDTQVIWSGRMRRRRPASGIKVSWAYAPGEVRVRTSPDLIHWDTVVDWHEPVQKDTASFEEDMFFDRPRNVFQVKLEMRRPQRWGFFGINQAALVM
eukprot:TRINITY_DN31846_c0_g1_i1.p1 TRINITY_DN31846_c0_g1~~TRINITY_DN31846_c0_g1_i1.p1  ORF type:complete len:220 (-),score=42.16 TRINITY_DN31846_c0_g1_i1:170-829(-)